MMPPIRIPSFAVMAVICFVLFPLTAACQKPSRPMAAAAPAASPMLTFDFLIEYQCTDMEGKVTQFQVLLDSASGALGFDKYMAGFDSIGEDWHFAVAYPKGQLVTYGMDPEQGKVAQPFSLTHLLPDAARKKEVAASFAQNHKPAGKSVLELEAGKFPATSWTASIGGGDTEEMTLIPARFNTWLLYLFNTLALDARLPVSHNFDFTGQVLPDQLVAKSVLVFADGSRSEMKLTYFSPTTYDFDPRGYKLVREVKAEQE